MRILLANYRYFVSGGPERYMFNISDALAARGHQVIPFSINYSRNHETPYSNFFVDPLGNRDQVLFAEQHRDPKTLWRTMQRLFYAPDVEMAVDRLATTTQPDVAYVLHYLRKLSPALLTGLKKANLPIVVRISDYAMLCPQAHCLRDGRPCVLCAKGNLWSSIRYRCIQDSLAASLLNGLATWFHRLRRYFDLIDVFVVTNMFMHNMMLSAGFPEERLRCIPTFVDHQVFHPGDTGSASGSSYVVYVGRLEAVKGVHVLLSAWHIFRQSHPDSPFHLRIAGSGDLNYTANLKAMCAELPIENVEFVGALNKEDLAELYRGALVSIVPSLWYENLPNSLLESLSSGTPVLASDLGSLSECVHDGQNGYLFPPGDAQKLAEVLAHCIEHPKSLNRMSDNAIQLARTVYSPERHVVALESLFMKLIS